MGAYLDLVSYYSQRAIEWHERDQGEAEWFRGMALEMIMLAAECPA